MDCSIAVSHLLEHMFPFLLSVRRASGGMARAAAIKEHYTYRDGVLFSLSFYLF